jgi:hypothetical protein
MSDATFRTVITIFVFLATLAMVSQAVFSFGTFRMVRQLRARLLGLLERAEPVVDRASRIVEEARPRIDLVTRTAMEVAETTRAQVQRYDLLLSEAAERARVQVDRIDYAVADTVEKLTETTAAMQRSLLRPVREVNGVMNGVRAALATLAMGRRPTVEQVTQDEEMFI